MVRLVSCLCRFLLAHLCLQIADRKLEHGPPEASALWPHPSLPSPPSTRFDSEGVHAGSEVPPGYADGALGRPCLTDSLHEITQRGTGSLLAPCQRHNAESEGSGILMHPARLPGPLGTRAAARQGTGRVARANDRIEPAWRKDGSVGWSPWGPEFGRRWRPQGLENRPCQLWTTFWQRR